MRHHAVVRSHGLTLDVPRPVEHLERLGHGESGAGEGLPELGRLADGRRVRDQDPAAGQRRLGVLHHLPGLGQVQDDPIQVLVVDALVAVPDLHPVPLHRLDAAEASTLCRARAAKSSRIS